MSTKIYNGYKLNIPFEQVPGWVLSLQGRFDEMANQELTRQLVHSAVAELDAEWMHQLRLAQGKVQPPTEEENSEGGENKRKTKWSRSQSALSVAWEEQCGFEKSERERKRDSMETTLVVIPLEGKVYALFYPGMREMDEIFRELPEVEYYGYWNNTDPDETVSEAEWEERGDVWEKALGSRAPVLCGPTFTLVEDKHIAPILTREANLQQFPAIIDPARRARVIATGEFISQWVKEGNALTASAYLSKAREISKDPAFVERVAALPQEMCDLSTPEGTRWLFMPHDELCAAARAKAHELALTTATPDSTLPKPRM